MKRVNNDTKTVQFIKTRKVFFNGRPGGVKVLKGTKMEVVGQTAMVFILEHEGCRYGIDKQAPEIREA